MAHPNTRTESRNRATSASTRLVSSGSSSKTFSENEKGSASRRAVSRRAYAASDETGTVAATAGTEVFFDEVFLEVVSFL